MIVGRFIIFLGLLMNFVYGCSVLICLSGGFLSVDILSNNIEVQS